MTNEHELPIIFLDVDGVINAFPNHSQSPVNWRTGKACPETGKSFLELGQSEPLWAMRNQPDTRKYKITWNPEVIERLVSFHTKGLGRIFWLTTWGEGARGELSELMELPDFECAHHPTEDDLHKFGDVWWKWRVAREFHEMLPNTKCVWLDDHLRVEPKAMDWARDVGWLALAPWEHEGLDMDHMDRIEGFLTVDHEDEAV